MSTEHNALLIRDIPPISAELEGNLTLESLRAHEVEVFDPRKAAASITQHEGATITTFDLGGGKVARQVFQVQSGLLVPTSDIDIQKGTDGDTYMNFLQGSKQTPFVGISCAGILKGTVLSDSPNARIFTKQLLAQYGGDFARLFPKSRVSLGNDAVFGVKAAGVDAYRRNPDVWHVLFAINGGGFGLAALLYDLNSDTWSIIALEPGHLKVPDDLNRFKRVEPCGVDDALYTCIEKIIASGAGVEGTYYQITGKHLDGREISKLYQGGDSFATDLYDTSAIGLAQVLHLVEKALNIKPNETMIAYHGGCFEVPGYVERTNQGLNRYTGQPHVTFKSTEVSANAGLTGAAISALMIA